MKKDLACASCKRPAPPYGPPTGFFFRLVTPASRMAVIGRIADRDDVLTPGAADQAEFACSIECLQARIAAG